MASGEGAAPGIASLMYMSPRSILAAIQTGTMKAVAEGLSKEQQRAVVEWITRRPLLETSMPASAYCAVDGSQSAAGAIDWSGWGGDITGAGFRDASRAGLTAETAKQLTLKWDLCLPGRHAGTLSTRPGRRSLDHRQPVGRGLRPGSGDGLYPLVL